MPERPEPPRPPFPPADARGTLTSSAPRDLTRRPGGEPWQGLTAEVSELVVCDPEASPVLCDAFLYEPEPHEEDLGSLFLTLETINLLDPSTRARGGPLEEQETPARALIDAVAEAVRDEYYRDSGRDMLTSFEAALAAANTRLATSAAHGDSDWLTNLQGTIAAFRERTLHVSRVGSASLFLARRGHLTDIGEGLSDPHVRNPKAAFTNIASGTIAEHDTLALTSPQLFRFLARERLASFLLGKHPRDIVVYLRDLIAESADPVSFAAVFLRFVRAPIALPVPRTTETVGRTILGVGESRVPPSVRGDLRRPRVAPLTPLRIQQRWYQRALTIGRRRLMRLWTLLATRAAPALARAGRLGADAAKQAAATTSASARGLIVKSWAPDAGGGDAPMTRRRERPQVLIARAREAPRRLRESITRWPRSTKVFSILTLVLAVLFVGSMTLLKQKREEQVAIRQASEALQEARVKKDAADAALIYDNVDQARQLLREARGSAVTVEQGPHYDAEASSLLAAIQVAEDKTERMTRLPEPGRVGDFRSVAPEGRATGLTVVGKNLFAFTPDTNAIYRLSIENGDAAVVSQSSQGVGYFRAVTPLAAEQMLLFTTDSPGLALFDTARGDLTKQELDTLPEGTKEIRALVTFGSRLYLLFPEHRQIYGYSKTLAGFSGGTSWLKDSKVAADRAVGMGVDGYIYLLTEDGKIIKLLKGAPVDFAQNELTTPLERPTRLVITDVLKFLYVLDPPQKRVVIYDTTGKLSRQFVFPNAQDLRDVTVSGKDETLYVLDGTAVYKVALK